MAKRINHRQLEAFRAVMITGVVTRAAEVLRVTQPAVTRLIGDLEYTLGFALFERRKGRLVPTVDAQVLYEEVEKSFVGVDKIAQIAEDIRRFNRGTLRIASMPAMALGFLPRVITRFLADRPEINVSLQVRSSQKVVEWIAAQQFDVGFVAIQASHPAVEAETLLATRLVCVMPEGHSLAARSVIAPKDLENEVFISLGTELAVRFMVDAVFDEAGVSRRLGIDTQLSEPACALVVEGAGVSLVEPITAAEFLGRGLVARPFEPAIPFEFAVLYPSYRPRARLAEDFVARVKTLLAENPLIG
jgi:DNA-binding transcriptional LysR family regulator